MSAAIGHSPPIILGGKIPVRAAIRIFAAVLCISTATPALAACPVGQYEAIGWNPGAPADSQPSYQAQVSIAERGADVCTIDWVVGRNQRFSAVALYDERTQQLHGSYANLEEGWFGVISYHREGDRWVGEWAIYNTGTSDRGREILTRRR